VKPYYEDGQSTIYHADCRDVLPDLDPVDLILTDPPYGITYVSNSGVGRGTQPISNDGTRISLRLYRSVLPLLRANHMLWFTRWDAWPDVWELLAPWFQIRGLLVWDKGSPGMGDLTHWGPSYELIVSAGAGKVKERKGSVIRCNTVPPGNRNHPTEKPVELLLHLIHQLSPATILDPFMGSGTTLVASKVSLGTRTAIGIESDERYCEIAAKRLAQGALDFGEAV
jgi:site-specific DNA-methyltransferase (adenine-specific)